MLKLSYLTALCAVSILSAGCDKDSDSPAPVTPPPVQEKPGDCQANVNVYLKWENSPKDWQYFVDIGFQKNEASESYILDAPKQGFTVNMDRGAHYFFRVAKRNDRGQSAYQYLDLEIPTCDQWDEFVQAHPTYSEPLIREIQW